MTLLNLKCLIAGIITNPAVRRHAVAAAKNAAMAIRAAMDSWNSSSYPGSIVERNRLGTAIYYLGKEEAIMGTLTQRTAYALTDANQALAETRAILVWGYVIDSKAVECLTSAQLQDVADAVRACRNASATQLPQDKYEQLCNELMELVAQKEDMDPEEAITFGQPAAVEIFRRRLCAEAEDAIDD